MKDETMMKLSLIITLIGIITLFVLTEVIEVGKYNIAEVTEGDVTVIGTIIDIIEYDKLTVFKVEDSSGEIEVVVFDTELKIGKGDKVEVSGEISSYKGKKQLEAESIILS
ncbi:MAG: OB-fold nucleic acid binding domain-containing protein [archaeon]